MNKRKGFTLIEVLIVVVMLSIIAITSLVLAPSLYQRLNTRFYSQEVQSKIVYYSQYAQNYITPVEIDVTPVEISFIISGKKQEVLQASGNIKFQSSTSVLTINEKGEFVPTDWVLTLQNGSVTIPIEFNTWGIIH